MRKHFILNLNPNAQFDWERCTLHHPITAGQPNFAQLIADEVGGLTGSYLVSVNVEVTVLEQAAIEQTVCRTFGKLELPSLPTAPQLAEIAA